MARPRVSRFAFVWAVSAVAATAAFAEGPTPAAVAAPAPPSQVATWYDTSPNWKLGLRAGYGKAFYQGSLESRISGTPALDGMPTASSGFHLGLNQVDLAIDLQTPDYFGPVSLFTTLGGGLSVGDTENSGANFGRWGMTGLSAAALQDNGSFYMHLGPSIKVPCPVVDDRSFDVRPYTGFDVHSYTGTLRLDESAFLNPATGRNFPIVDDTRGFTRVNPLLGFESVFHVCSHDCGGLDFYAGYSHSFSTSGSTRISAMTPGGFSSYALVNPGDIDRIYVGAQWHFNFGGNGN
jgi:hypothetical protein